MPAPGVGGMRLGMIDRDDGNCLVSKQAFLIKMKTSLPMITLAIPVRPKLVDKTGIRETSGEAMTNPQDPRSSVAVRLARAWSEMCSPRRHNRTYWQVGLKVRNKDGSTPRGFCLLSTKAIVWILLMRWESRGRSWMADEVSLFG